MLFSLMSLAFLCVMYYGWIGKLGLILLAVCFYHSPHFFGVENKIQEKQPSAKNHTVRQHYFSQLLESCRCYDTL